MENPELASLLARIATALERIANAVDKSAATDANGEGDTLQNDCSTKTSLPVAGCTAAKPLVSPQSTCNTSIANFLADRGIKVNAVPQAEAADDVLNSLAKRLGEDYDALRALHSNIKRNMQHGGTFTLSLKECAADDISRVCQYGHTLHEHAFLEDFRYVRSQRLISAKTTICPMAQNFFAGKWLERYVLLLVQEAVEEVAEISDFQYLLNPKVVLPNGNDFELDLVFQVHDSFFWIEAKSANYQQHIQKYANIVQIMKLDAKHSILVLPDTEIARQLTALYNITVLPMSQMKESLITTIKADQNGQIGP